MSATRLAGALLLCLLLAGCEDTAERQYGGLERFGLLEWPPDHPVLLAAIDLVNDILPADAQKFSAGWVPGQNSGVPVYAVRSQLGPTEIMSTFSECGCVVVQASALDAWFADKVGTGTALLTIEPAQILAYMLLHEAGHIARDAAVADATEAGSTQGGYNLDETVQKQREEDADEFAASAIKLGLEAGGDRGYAAAQISLALTNLSWNLTAHRLLDDFGGTVLRKPSLFWDRGLSHPNLEWRVLVVNDLIAGTDTTHQLLTEFEAARSQGTDGILWQAPQSN